MDLEDIHAKEEELKDDVRKNCMLCMGRARLGRPKNPEREGVQQDLKDLYALYEDKFNKLRRADADGAEITNSGDNKRYILDVISACDSCSRENEKAKRAMAELK